MYYVTFIDAGTGDNPSYSRLAIRGVKKVLMAGSDLMNSILLIVSKLGQIIKTKSYIEKHTTKISLSLKTYLSYSGLMLF